MGTTVVGETGEDTMRWAMESVPTIPDMPFIPDTRTIQTLIINHSFTNIPNIPPI